LFHRWQSSSADRGGPALGSWPPPTHLNSNSCANQYGNTLPYRYPNTAAYRHPIAHAYAHRYAVTYTYTYTYTYSYSFAYCYSDAITHTYSHEHADTDCNEYPFSHPHPHSISDAHCYQRSCPPASWLRSQCWRYCSPWTNPPCRNFHLVAKARLTIDHVTI